MIQQLRIKGPQKHISISILWGYSYLIGLLYKGDIPILIFAYVLFWGPTECFGTFMTSARAPQTRKKTPDLGRVAAPKVI